MMKVFLASFLIVILSFGNNSCDDEFVTVWAPKAVFESGDYNIFYLPKGINEKIKPKISFQFRKKNATVDLKNNESLKIKFPSRITTGTKKDFNLFVTLYRKITKSDNPVEQCVTKKLTIKSEKRSYYTFIQTDKPIYKPGDEVKFRVLVIDRNLKPHHMNNIHVNITDPLNRSIKEFDDLGDVYLGVFSSGFNLSTNTPLGDWKIRVVVDKMHHFEYSKEFSVQKYTLPPFDVFISSEKKRMLLTDDLKISFHAQYSFGEFVIGNAKLIVKDSKTGKQYLSESFQNVKGVEELTYSIKNKLKVSTSTKLDLEATISYSEPESSYSVNKSIRFSIHGDTSRKIRPIHDEKFVPGLPFNMKVIAYEWDGEIIDKNNELVHISYKYKLKNNQNKIASGNVEIIDGLATFNSVAPNNAVGLTVEVKFSNSITYRNTIEMGEKSIGRNEISVDYLPKKPHLNNQIEIFIKSTIELDTIAVVIMTRFGISESFQFNCNKQQNCKLKLKVTKEMIPQATITVYYVKDTQNVYYGRTYLVTDNFGENYLNVTLPTTAKTKEKINIKFETMEDSKIYVLAYDKRLTYLKKGNDIETDDIVKSVAAFEDGSIIYNANLKSWKTCTDDEIKRVQSGKIEGSHSGNTLYADGDEDDFIPYDEIELTGEEVTDPIEDDLREYFPETWIFKDFEADGNGFVESMFTVPDSITSWMISAFSVNENFGLAVAPTKELEIKNEFFMKMILPYSIRFKEIFRLDFLVYNYVKTKKSIEVKVDLHNKYNKEFEFVEYEGNRPSFKNVKNLSKNVTVSHSNLKKVSFYIRPLSKTNQIDGYEKVMKLYCYGDATDTKGKPYKDSVKKQLRVEPAGVKIYEIHNKNYELDGSREQYYQISVGNAQTLSEDFYSFPKLSMAIAGDYLTDTINMNSRFEFYPTDDIEQKTSKLKGNVEYFRYLKSTSNRPATSRFSDYYQSLLKQQTARWRFGAPAGYRAYFAEAIASAMEIGALPLNKRIIQNELDALKALQTENGDFKNFGNFPEFLATDRDETANFFQTSFVLIPFLKFKGFVKKNYDDVIKKGFRYLNNVENRLKIDNEGLAIAAYAYALNENFIEAQNLLNQVENEKSEISQKQKCLKISSSDSKCDLRHTSYAAIAHFTMSQSSSAKPMINWLLESNNLNKYYANTHAYAIATEAIAKLAMSRRKYGTNFTIEFKNEVNFNKTVNIEEKNLKNPLEIDFPEYSLTGSMKIYGHGFCSVTTIVEKTVALQKTTPDFEVTIKQAIKKMNSNERTFKVCAVYDPQSEQNMAMLYNVVYDIEMPSGYLYLSLVDFEIRAHDIKMVVPRQRSSKVIVYFNEFKQSKEYCVDIQVRKAFEVKDAQDAGVKVYDYNNKQNVAIQFYKLD